MRLVGGWKSTSVPRDFGLLASATVVSTTGTQIVLLVLPIEIYRATQSPVAVALVWAAYLVPGALFGVVGGVLTDRWDQKRTLVTASVAQAAVVLLLLPTGFSHWLWLVGASAFLEALMGQLVTLAQQGLVPRTVQRNHLLRANSTSAVGIQIARTIGPLIGAALLATSGFTAAVIVDSLSFLGAAALISRIRTSPEGSSQAHAHGMSILSGIAMDLRMGIAEATHSRAISSMLLVGGLGLFGGTAFQVLLVPFAIDVLGQSETFLGTALALRGFAAIVGGMSLIRWGAMLRPSLLMAIGLGGLGLGIAIQAVMPSQIGFLAFMVVAGPLIVTVGSSQQTILQASADPRTLGRIMGLSGSSGGVLALAATLLAGAVATVAGVTAVLAATGLLLVGVGMVGLAIIPRAAGTTQSPSHEGAEGMT